VKLPPEPANCSNFLHFKNPARPVKKTKNLHFESTRTKMEVPAALNITPLNAPHRELDYLPLIDEDFQMKDLHFDESPLLSFCRCRDEYSKGQDLIGLWESNFPRYLIPSVLIFPEIIHYCHANYDPNKKAVLSPSQSVSKSKSISG